MPRLRRRCWSGWPACRIGPESGPTHRFAESSLGAGECEAIALALELAPAELLIDERIARAVAIQKGLVIRGTVGVLEEAAMRGLIDLPSTLEKLRQTNFRLEEALFHTLLERDALRRRRTEGH